MEPISPIINLLAQGPQTTEAVARALQITTKSARLSNALLIECAKANGLTFGRMTSPRAALANRFNRGARKAVTSRATWWWVDVEAARAAGVIQ